MCVYACVYACVCVCMRVRERGIYCSALPEPAGRKPDDLGAAASEEEANQNSANSYCLHSWSSGIWLALWSKETTKILDNYVTI